jgi:ribosomal-protein-alanine N-acetyltransferase
MKPLDIDALTNIPIFDLGDLILRPVHYEDYHDIYEYGSMDDVTQFLAWDSYQSIEEVKQAVRTVFLQRPQNGVPSAYAIVHKNDHKMIGTCDIFKVEWHKNCGEIGYVLHKDYWNKGYMTRVLQEVIKFGFEYLGLDAIDIRHLPENIGSRRVIEKAGFRFISDQYYPRFDRDIPSYEMTKEEYQRQYLKK